MSKRIIATLPIIQLYGNSTLLNNIKKAIKVKDVTYSFAYNNIDVSLHTGANIVAYVSNGEFNIGRWNDATLFHDEDYNPSKVAFSVEQFVSIVNSSIVQYDKPKPIITPKNNINNTNKQEMKIDFKNQVVIGDNNITKEELALIIEENHINLQQEKFECDKAINKTERDIVNIKTTHPLNIKEYVNLVIKLNKLEDSRAIINALESELELDEDTIFKLKN